MIGPLQSIEHRCLAYCYTKQIYRSSPVNQAQIPLYTTTLHTHTYINIYIYIGPPQSINAYYASEYHSVLLLLYHVVVVTVLCCSCSYITMYVQLQINKKITRI